MDSPSPRRTLFLLWSIAGLVLAGGILLARREKQLRYDRDREAVRSFAAAAQARLQRLEDLYQDHLTRLGREAVPNALETASAAHEVTGVMQVSLLHPGPAGIGDFHALVDEAPDGGVPLPVLPGKVDPVAPGRSVVVLDEDRLFGRASGWIDEPGKPLMYYVNRTTVETAVIVVSRAAVGESIGEWLRKWSVKSFEPVHATGGPDQLREGAEILAGVGTGVSGALPPDLILPLRSRFGSFEVVSWDVRKDVVQYHPATLAVSAALAAVIAILGFIVYLAQRREHAIATQRVSFVNRVSHELRTPLTNILLNVDLALELAEDAPEESARRLGLVRIEARRLGRLIENVLSFSRSEEGKMEVRSAPCVPAEIVSTVIDQFAPSFERRGLRIERRDENADVACLCDADALAQILGNLLSNVEKYVPGGVVGITTRLAGGEMVVRISDEGPGIPPEAIERIFHPFERVHSVVNEGASGTGLGLAIARDLATRLGGSLRLVSTPPDSGSCFELRIPAPPVTAPHPKP